MAEKNLEDDYFARLDAEKREALKRRLDGEASVAADDALRELHHFKCGKCGHDMTTQLFRGIEIEVCGTCQAVLLDPGELEQLAGSDEGLFKDFFGFLGRK
ncbi:MAG: zf-TFIIB domain-containing protein [Proteobacteria bacterium]|nr:zf-TFIIB domain-containing protein [Pseudomonadota bacterium]